MTHLCQNILNSHFNVIGIFDLNKYAQNMEELLVHLTEVKKSYYNTKDRFVFTLFDHDFYLDGQGPGWTLYNLQLILNYLDISNFFCLLLTNQPNYNEFTKYVQTQLTTDDFPIRAITTLMNSSCLPRNVPERLPMDNQIEKSYCVLSRQSRPHRTFFISKLIHENLQNHGLIGYNNIPFEYPKDQTMFAPNSMHKSLPNSQAKRDDTIPFDMQKQLNFSFLQIPKKYQRIKLANSKNRSIFKNFEQTHKFYKNFEENFDVSDKVKSAELEKSTPLVKGFLYIGIETEVSIPRPFTTRISLRGIIEQRPFVLFACPGELSFIQERGFQTFNQFWNEDYDQILDLEDRVDSIINIVKYVSSLNSTDLKDLYNQMHNVLDYNQKFYHHGFAQQEKTYLENEILKNIKGEIGP